MKKGCISRSALPCETNFLKIREKFGTHQILIDVHGRVDGYFPVQIRLELSLHGAPRGVLTTNSFDRPLMPIFIPYNIFVSDDVNTIYEESSCEFFALSLKFSRSVELKN